MMSTSQSTQIDEGEETVRGRELWADIHADIATPPFLEGELKRKLRLTKCKSDVKIAKIE